MEPATMTMLAMASVNLVGSLFGGGTKVKYVNKGDPWKYQQQMVETSKEMLQSEREHNELVTDFNIKMVNAAYSENYARLNSDYALLKSQQYNQTRQQLDKATMAVGARDRGIDARVSSSIGVREVIDSQADENLIRMTDEQIQKAEQLSDQKLQSILGITEDYYKNLANSVQQELSLSEQLIGLEMNKTNYYNNLNTQNINASNAYNAQRNKSIMSAIQELGSVGVNAYSKSAGGNYLGEYNTTYSPLSLSRVSALDAVGGGVNRW